MRRSTITQIESYPFVVGGNPTMKSILISSHFHEGISKGWSIPAGLRWLALTLRQISHSDTYLATSRFILVHQNRCLRSWYILVLPGWMEYLERWASSRICFRSSKSLGTTSRFLNHKTPSPSKWKHATRGSFYLSLCLIFSMPILSFWAAITWSRRVGVRTMLARVPSATIAKFIFSISWHKVSCKTIAETQLQLALRLNASATTFALPGW